jgi:hypothetical protein
MNKQFVVVPEYIKAELGNRIRNRIRRIRMFLGLLDPDPDLLVRGTAPDPSLFS